nr:hypothetical protein [Mute swan feces associated noda-like virus 2]
MTSVSGITIDNSLSGYIGVSFAGSWDVLRSKPAAGTYMAEVTVMYVAYSPSQRLALQDLTAGDTDTFAINAAPLKFLGNTWLNRTASSQAPAQLVKSYSGVVPTDGRFVSCAYFLRILGLSPAGTQANHLFDITVRLV